MEYHCIYPDDWNPGEKRLRNWLCDAIANGEVDDPLLISADAFTLPMDEVAQILNDTGRVTLIPVE